ncbi:concanavalin A-like lectin/glucanase domain-containing protein [Hyaloraphidium curvatum]|nr:concanavalin A-like lectin/glucanase domain-containing protein [Hyaloraphidium curvatum]
MRAYGRSAPLWALAALLAFPAAHARDLPSTLAYPLRAAGVCSGFFRDDFTNPSGILPASEWNADPDRAWWVDEFGAGSAIRDGVLQLNLRRYPPSPRGREAAVTWTRWWQYGEVCARVRAGRGGGVVSAFFVAGYVPGKQFDDEIDLEWVGRNMYEVQSNFFSEDKGIYGVHGGYHPTGVNAFDNYQTLCIERTPDWIVWRVDGRQVRAVSRAQLGADYPDAPSKVVLDIWDGGVGVEPGVSNWAGGPTWWGDNNNPEYRMLVDWVTIRCDNPGGAPPPPPPPPSGGGSSGSGAGNARCADRSICFGGSSAGSGGSNSSSTAGGPGATCTASDERQCQSGCCYQARCVDHSICFGGNPPRSAAPSSSAPDIGAACTASDETQCRSGCCFEARCADRSVCFGGAPAPSSGGSAGKPDSSTCSASGPECASGCCYRAVCTTRSVCFG